MKIDWKSKEIRYALIAFSTFVACVLFWRIIEDIDNLLGAVSVFLAQVGSVSLPFVLGGLMAYILLPCVRFIENKMLRKLVHDDKWRKGIAVLLTYLLLIAALCWLLSYLVPLLVSNVMDFGANLPHYLTDGEQLVARWMAETPLISEPAVKKAIESALVMAGDHIEVIAKQVAEGALQAVVKVSGVFTDTFIAFMISIYLLFDGARMKNSLKRLIRAVLGQVRAEKVFQLGKDFDGIFGKYVRARLFESALVFAAVCIGFMVYPVPYAVLFALINAITNLVPFFGPIVGFVITVVLVALISPDKVLYAAIFITALQQLDGYVIGPKVMGDGVNLRPFFIMFAVSAGGAFLGVPGMVLGVPVIAFLGAQLSRFNERKLGGKEEPKTRKCKK